MPSYNIGNNNIGPTTDSPRQSTLFISIGFGIAGLFFVVIVCLCFVICRNKKKTAQETYNQYSHVDQTEVREREREIEREREREREREGG